MGYPVVHFEINTASQSDLRLGQRSGMTPDAVPERGRRIARTRFARLSPMASVALGAPALMF
jgi:hypothetical protein